MPDRQAFMLLISVALGATLSSPLGATSHTRHHQDPSAPRILLDQSPRAVEYQLGRLTNDELALVDRKDSDPRYRPVYLALLTRKGMPAQYRDEAVVALAKLEKTTADLVILAALAKVPPDDQLTAEKLLGLLFAQPADALREDRPAFAKAAAFASEPIVRSGAYGALMIADGKPEPAWQAALGQGEHIVDLLRSLPHLGKHDALRQQLFAPVSALAAGTKDAATRTEAIGTLGWTRRDAATFDLLAQEVIKGTDEEARRAAIRSLQALPEDIWPSASLEPLARAIVTTVGELPPGGRTEPAVLDEIQFGERLAAKLPGDAGRTVRRDLRALGVQVVRIQTLPEKLSFDLRWFVAEAGKPVQIVLVNPDAMPHNLVVSQPGSLEEVGTKGGAMPMPADPAATDKAFVPDTPLVLHATNLLKEGETARLAFTAPQAPGEYIYVCTFPGHWVRMYGVMLVVDKLEAWEAKPTVPTDPMTKQPFTSQRN
jgi:azurin